MPEQERRRWLALVILCVGQLMIVLDVTVVNVALPAIQTDLHFSQASLAWVVNAYLLSFGGLLLLSGRLGDLIGRRRVFTAGLSLFTGASLLCGLAPSEGLLIAARFLQGMGAAMIASMVLGILVTIFPRPREMATAMSVYAFVASAGGSIGLLVGGGLTQALSWHWIFYINLPIGVAAVLLGAALIPEHEGIGLHHGVDSLGAILVTAVPSLAVYGIIQASDVGWGSPRTVGIGAAVAALAAFFIIFESRIANPLIPLRIFQARNMVGANIVRSLFPVGLFGTFFLGALFLQHVLGFSAWRTGLAFLPQNLVVGVFSLALTGRLVRRFGAKATLIAGLTLVTIGLLLFSRVPSNASYVSDVLPVMLIIGAGAGLVFMPSVNIAMAGAGPRDAGLASGFTNVALQFGAAIGIAVLASVSAAHSNDAIVHGVATGAALTSGYHLGLVVAAGCVALAAIIGLLVLRTVPLPPSEARVAPEPEPEREREVALTASVALEPVAELSR